jgi:hypothetical protein
MPNNIFHEINLNVVFINQIYPKFFYYLQIDSKKILFYFLNLNKFKIQDQNNNTFDSCKLLVLTSILLISPLIVSYLDMMIHN